MKLTKICLIFNSLDEISSTHLISRYLPANQFDVTITTTFPENPENFTIIVPFSYRKIISEELLSPNVVIFHSSALPHGRGWAPIAYTILEKQPIYTLTGLIASREVDCGDILVSASFPMMPNYTAPFLRLIDHQIMFYLIGKVALNWHLLQGNGVPQDQILPIRKRRNPSDSCVDLNQPLIEILPLLRAAESSYPVYCFYDNVKYLISALPDPSPSLPKVIINFPSINLNESWIPKL